ncbi:RNA-binding protein, putative [Plasmodium chabaudi adami]|uniref:RNA-binding protein, putative n=1 Tax=Plasmodium chabaudi adami TaxID=5826 RepID=A0A1C6YMB4_PLACE|nr:RNA-binding protein, putative [Plasmodium chabaudi adami]
MAITNLCGMAEPQQPSTMKTFLTKTQHDIALTATDTRVFIKNIKTGVTMNQFKRSLEKYGALQVYFYEPKENDEGWAWVGFENKEAAEKAIEDAEKAMEHKESSENNEVNSSVDKNEDNDNGSGSFYVEENEGSIENQENEVNEEENDNDEEDD